MCAIAKAQKPVTANDSRQPAAEDSSNICAELINIRSRLKHVKPPGCPTKTTTAGGQQTGDGEGWKNGQIQAAQKQQGREGRRPSRDAAAAAVVGAEVSPLSESPRVANGNVISPPKLPVVEAANAKSAGAARPLPTRNGRPSRGAQSNVSEASAATPESSADWTKESPARVDGGHLPLPKDGGQRLPAARVSPTGTADARPSGSLHQFVYLIVQNADACSVCGMQLTTVWKGAARYEVHYQLCYVGGVAWWLAAFGMNEVNARRARLVLGWVTVFGRVFHFGM